jgi:hypothetical protein
VIISIKKIPRSIPIILGCVLISACSGVGKQEQIHFIDRGGIDIFTDLQNGVNYGIVPASSGDKLCRSPSPDALAGESDSTALSFMGDNLGADESFNVQALGGRSPEVLITRELMYRLCELTVNVHLSNEDALKLYDDTIGKITDMVKSVAAETGTSSSGFSGTVSMETLPSTSSNGTSFGDDGSSSAAGDTSSAAGDTSSAAGDTSSAAGDTGFGDDGTSSAAGDTGFGDDGTSSADSASSF